MVGLGPAIYVFLDANSKDVDGGAKPRHDGGMRSGSEGDSFVPHRA
jgi:hypothetical protein